MKVEFTRRESSALYWLLADVTSDIILKTDRKGFIIHASPALERLGIALPGMLIGPHIRDLVHPACADAIAWQHDAAIAGQRGGDWLEFAVPTDDDRERWFEVQMRGLVDEQGQVYGALSIMRSIEERRAFEERLFAAALTDPLTGLSNRRAFIAMLQHMIAQETGGYLALFALDQLKAINMKFGQVAGDEALLAFAHLLRSLLRGQDIISRIGGDSLAVLLPATTTEDAEAICQRLLAALAERRPVAGVAEISLAASAGIGRIAGSVDDTLKRAEMALFFAKTSGRGRLEVDGKRSARWSHAAGVQ